MSCEISHGRIEECKNSVSGLKSIFIINFDDLNEDAATFDTGTTDEEDELVSWTHVDICNCFKLV